jgi:predicted TIM-barrel fold metal-dependent hydrolase
MKVDVHTHCYPKIYVDELKKIGFGDLGAAGVKLPQWTSLDQRLENMDAHGIDVQVLGVSYPNVYFPDPVLSRDLAQMTNDFIADVCKKFPDRFLGLASIPLNHMQYAIDELNRTMETLGMDGVLLGSNVNRQSIGEPQFLPFFEEINKRHIPLVLHPMAPPKEESSSEEFIRLGIPNSVGFVYETTKVMVQMTFRGTFEEYKNLIFVLPHAGGMIPFVYPRWDIQHATRPETHPLRALPHPPSYYLRRHYYDTALSYYPSSIRCTLDFAGIDHLLLGTDVPFSGDERIHNTIQGVEEYGFSEDDKDKIYYKNAEKIFKRLS